MKFDNLPSLLLSVLLVSGCTSVPVGWGGTYEVVYADKDTVSIQWDRTFTTEDVIRNIAIEHCAKTGRGAQVIGATSDSATMGLVRSTTFGCKDRPLNS